MRITLLRKNLSEALKIASSAISTQVDLMILSNLLIKADQNSLQISATDLEIGVELKIRGKVEETGEIAVPAQIFNEFINNSTSEKINIETKEDTLYLDDGHNKAQIKGQPAEEFPQIPDIEQEKVDTISIPATELLKALIRVQIAPAHDDSRPVLAGILFRTKSNSLILAGTDSYRLAEEKINLEETAKSHHFIVPIKACQELIRILEKSVSSQVEIIVAENQIGFRVNDTELVSRQIEGDYPDYQQIIPEKFQTEVVLSREEFHNATKTAWLFSRDQANNIVLKVGSGGKVKILATSPQVGESESVIEAKETKGPKVEISFNVKFINDVLSIMKSDQVVLKLNQSMEPGMIKGTDLDRYLYIIMPLKND